MAPNGMDAKCLLGRTREEKAQEEKYCTMGTMEDVYVAPEQSFYRRLPYRETISVSDLRVMQRLGFVLGPSAGARPSSAPPAPSEEPTNGGQLPCYTASTAGRRVMT
jgi:hypothetical protein